MLGINYNIFKRGGQHLSDAPFMGPMIALLNELRVDCDIFPSCFASRLATVGKEVGGCVVASQSRNPEDGGGQVPQSALANPKGVLIEGYGSSHTSGNDLVVISGCYPQLERAIAEL